MDPWYIGWLPGAAASCVTRPSHPRLVERGLSVGDRMPSPVKYGNVHLRVVFQRTGAFAPSGSVSDAARMRGVACTPTRAMPCSRVRLRRIER